MCYGCWEKAGKPAIINEKTQLAAALCLQVYEFSMGAGSAHVVIDDWNVHDEAIHGNLVFIERVKCGFEEKEHEHDPEELECAKMALEALQELTEPERYSALAIQEGYVKVK